MHISAMTSGEEVFTWCDPDTGANLHFAVTQMNRFAAGAMVHTLAYPEGFNDFLLQNRGVDIKRAAALTPQQLEAPVTVLLMDKQTLLVDGTHRSYARYCDGLRSGPCHILPRAVWAFFLIEGIRDYSPNEILALPTDRLAHRRAE